MGRIYNFRILKLAVLRVTVSLNKALKNSSTLMFLPVRFPGRNFVDISCFPMHTSLLHAVLQQLLSGAHDGF